jgi:hypothetical protein
VCIDLTLPHEELQPPVLEHLLLLLLDTLLALLLKLLLALLDFDELLLSLAPV